MSQSFKSRLNNLKQTHSYKVEVAKLEFVRGISRLLKLKRISNAELAAKIDTSSAYITKALRGESNFTIDSMVKLASAVGANLHIHIADTTASVRWLEVHPQAPCQDEPSKRPDAEHHYATSSSYSISNGIREAVNEARQIYA